MTRQRSRRNSRSPRNNNNNNNNNRSSGERKFETKFTPWEPTSLDDAYVMNRFITPPRPPPLKVVVNGQEIEIPRYNGVAWWFPQQTPHPLERFFCNVFSIVNSVQTLSLFVWAGVLVRHLKLWTIAVFLISVPLGWNLEETYGSNYGTAYTALNTLRLSVYLLEGLLSLRSGAGDEDEALVPPSRLVVGGCYCVLALMVGHGFCMAEKHVFGRTWHAFFLAYSELAYWLYCGFTYVRP